MTFAGVCYDGPLEGEHWIKPDSSFTIGVWEGKYSKQFTVRRGLYRWSHPLRKWVFQW
jgi:hypothetical protein